MTRGKNMCICVVWSIFTQHHQTMIFRYPVRKLTIGSDRAVYMTNSGCGPLPPYCWPIFLDCIRGNSGNDGPAIRSVPITRPIAAAILHPQTYRRAGLSPHNPSLTPPPANGPLANIFPPILLPLTLLVQRESRISAHHPIAEAHTSLKFCHRAWSQACGLRQRVA